MNGKFFFDKDSYSWDDVETLINNSVQEDINLDFKDGRSLVKDDKKYNEISKDVAAFANTNGGLLIYGISEAKEDKNDKGKASQVSFVDSTAFSVEKLDLIIRQKIKKPIDGVKIFPVYKNEDPKQCVYFVKIPESYQGPHMSADHKFYKRSNCECVPMEEFEVEQVYKKILSPKLLIDNSIFKKESEYNWENYATYSFQANIINNSQTTGEHYKLNAYFNIPFKEITYMKNVQTGNKLNFFELNERITKTSFPSKEFIYPYELLNISNAQIKVRKDYLNKLHNLVVLLRLYYQGGVSSAVVLQSPDKQFITDKESIDTVVQHYFYDIEF